MTSSDQHAIRRREQELDRTEQILDIAHELTSHLRDSHLDLGVCEVQGMLCAMLCAGAPRAEESWTAELLAGTEASIPQAQEFRSSLHDLAVHTQAALTSPGIVFTPLLPDDSLPLAERALGLYDFARGFLYGFGLAGFDASRLPGRAREAFDDLAALTRLDLDDLEDTENNEQALMELTEFVRVAVLLLFEERGREE